MASNNVDFTFKILLLGDGAVGKTSLVNRFVNDKFTNQYLHTIGMQPSSKYLTIGSKNICFSIFDIAGEQSFKRLREMFYKGARGALITFDLTKKSSFNNVQSWYKEAKSKSKGTLFILVGNKNDLPKREVSSEDAKKLANKLKCEDYIETSALSGEMVEETFNLLGETIMKHTMEMK